jgi:hypothetical protein
VESDEILTVGFDRISSDGRIRPDQIEPGIGFMDLSMRRSTGWKNLLDEFFKTNSYNMFLKIELVSPSGFLSKKRRERRERTLLPVVLSEKK